MLDRVFISETDITYMDDLQDKMYRFTDRTTVHCAFMCSRCPVERYKKIIKRDPEKYPTHTHCAQIVDVICETVDKLESMMDAMDTFLLTQEDE